MARLFSLVVLSMALASCAAGEPAVRDAGAPALQDSEWQAVLIGGRQLAAAAPWVRFARDGSLGGNTGCNSFGGRYAVDGQSIRIERLFATRKACGATIMDQERRFLEALETATRHETAAGSLVLRGPGRPTRFTRR